jgi:hypothetical protein
MYLCTEVYFQINQPRTDAEETNDICYDFNEDTVVVKYAQRA